MQIEYAKLHPEYQGLADDLGPPLDREPFTADDLDYIRERLPPKLADFMAYSGKATYLEGAITICNPRELAPILALVFKGDGELSHKDCTVVSYSAFGDFRIWSKLYRNIDLRLAEGEVNSQVLAPVQFAPGLIPPAKGVPDLNIVAASSVIDAKDKAEFLDYAGQGMLDRCIKQHGPLRLGQCYGFFPALALIGWDSPTRSVEHIRKVQALEHFAFLAQAQPFHLTTLGRNGVERVREIG
jgi:hypothetical protein